MSNNSKYNTNENIIGLNGEIKSIRQFNQELLEQLNHQLQLIRRIDKQLEQKVKFREKLLKIVRDERGEQYVQN